MSFREELAKAREGRPEPVLVGVAVGESLYQVEVSRLDGMDWASIMADAIPTDEKGARLGYDTNKASLLACRKFSRLLGPDGEPKDMAPVMEDGRMVSDPWGDLFKTISGTEVGAIAATWWALNMRDPNQKVVDLKKLSAGGGKTS